MTRLAHLLRRRWQAFRAGEDGTTLVELTLAIALFLLLFLGMIDFGRLAHHNVMTEKAMQIAARTAAVRPPACAGVPEVNARGGDTTVRFGTSCSASAGACAAPAEVSCLGATSNATVNEIWTRIANAMPPGTTPANLRFKYQNDPNLGFLGGPYVPMVTVELEDATFTFVSPLGALADLASNSTGSTLGGTIDFPAFSVSLPGEDLALGTNG